jgi:hypothetical protein
MTGHHTIPHCHQNNHRMRHDVLCYCFVVVCCSEDCCTSRAHIMPLLRRTARLCPCLHSIGPAACIHASVHLVGSLCCVCVLRCHLPGRPFSACTPGCLGASHCLFATTAHFCTALPNLAGVRHAAGSWPFEGQPLLLNSASQGLQCRWGNAVQGARGGGGGAWAHQRIS